MTTDRYAWALETAEAVRAGDLDRIDRTTLAEELEQMSRADRRELLKSVKSKYGEKRFASAPKFCPFTAADILTGEG